MLNTKEAHRKLVAAQALLLEPATTREKLNAACTILKGVHPKVDSVLGDIEKHLSTWDKVESGDVLQLSAEHLPENTEEEKRRKKLALLFLNSWKQLKGEVERVRAEMAAGEQSQTGGEKTSHWGKILGKAKGPLGLVTIVAIGLTYMQQTSVQLTIENKGCATMYPSSSIPISIPGLSLPKEPIASGDSAIATLPGLTVSVDGTSKSIVSLKVLTYSISIQLPSNVKNVTLNGSSLLGKTTEVKLSDKDAHVLTLSCS